MLDSHVTVHCHFKEAKEKLKLSYLKWSNGLLPKQWLVASIFRAYNDGLSNLIGVDRFWKRVLSKGLLEI